MWVSKKAWREMQDTVGGLKADARGRDNDYDGLRLRVEALERQVSDPELYRPGLVYYLSANGPMSLGCSSPTKSVTLLQKVNLLLDHLKLRVQPEGTTPVALVKKTGGK